MKDNHDRNGDYQASLELQVKALKREIDELRGGGARPAGTDQEVQYTIKGMEEMYMLVTPDFTIRKINSALARFFGVDQEDLAGRDLAALDDFPWGRGLFRDLLDQAVAFGGDMEIQREIPGSGDCGPRFVRILASPGQNMHQILLQDTTRMKTLREHFSRYVPSTVIDRMLATDRDFMRTERREMTVLFADLRGFTSMCTNLEPEKVRDIVNAYLENMTRVIMEHEGTIDKFVGDEVMVNFGAPLPQEDHAVRAVYTAIAMQRAHAGLQDLLSSRGDPAPPVGIGINTGEMVVGNIGCMLRMDYTVLGHNVNLGARLCGQAEGGEILVSKGTEQAIRTYAESHDLPVPIELRKKGELQVKGISEPVKVRQVRY